MVEKSGTGGGFTTSTTCAVCVVVPSVALTVKGNEPVVAPAVVVTLRVADVPAATLAGLTLAVTPAGTPLTDSASVPAYPPLTAVFTE